MELSTGSKRRHVNTPFERADSKFRDRRRCRYCQNVVHISDVCMLVQTVSITRCVLPFRDRRSCRHCRSAETYIRQMLVQRYNNSNRTFAASADRSCRHGINAARILTRTRILVQKYRVLFFPGMRFLLPLHDNWGCRLGRNAGT